MRVLLAIAVTLSCAIGAAAEPAQKAAAARVTVEAGDIFIEQNGQRRQLTTLGHNSDAALSPDGTFVVFTRSDDKPPPDNLAGCKTGADGDQLRRIDADGKDDRLLVAAHAGKTAPQQLCRFEQKQFTSDGRKLFFIAPGWVTSGALHVYDFAKQSVSFVAPANAVIVLNFCAGEHRDQLVLNQHRYFIGGGSYDWYWLYDSDGRKQIGPVGDDGENPESIIAKAHDVICAP